MAKTVKGLLQYVSYTAQLDFIEVSFRSIKHLFPACDIVTRDIIEKCYPQLLNRELCDGIHAEGHRKDRIVIPLKPL